MDFDRDALPRSLAAAVRSVARGRRFRGSWLAVGWLIAQGAASASVPEAIARGDQAYERRSEGRQGLWAAAGPISEAIAAYEEALTADPGNHVARTRLLRALFFQGDYVLKDREAKLAVFERGQTLGEEGITRLLDATGLDRRGAEDFDRLIAHLETHGDVAGLYYWTAVHWGVWGRHRGKIAAARQGVAGRVRDYALIVNALDSDYEGGSGHRMLGRLHAEAPRIPFVTGWIDREVAVAELELARSLSDDSLTLLYYVEALLDYVPSRRREAMEILRRIAAREGPPYDFVEERRAVDDARALLESLDG